MGETFSAKRGMIRKQRCHSLEFLPNDLLLRIFGNVSSESIEDISNVKLTCKSFLRLAEHDSVYKHASLDKFKLEPLEWMTGRRSSRYHVRVHDDDDNVSSNEVKVSSLKTAAMNGHDDAKYMYGMLLMCSDNEAHRNQGVSIFRLLDTSERVKQCRKRVKTFIRSLWMRRTVVPQHQSSFCHSNLCINLEPTIKRDPWILHDEYDDDGPQCENCKADFELKLFCSMTGV
ncbi:uncharacterized protein LOC133300043 [Gastrolobium bilobum]|uniref:uncharacterized protein LOC133300043 n=1 Tax=Gastrolobium bilobum TaxID=150636 RepID=UPI002AAF5954|nr:uncharacterized protein LOC133300043 [Gastrolobium bilobum]